MTFEVETSSLNSTVKSMETELQKISEVSKRLYQALEALDAMWVGAAHDTFSLQYESDQATLRSMIKTISAVIEGLDKARRTYEDCEHSVKTEIKKIVI